MKICICAIIKNENDYLEEWIEWHLKLGFSEIYLYEDYDSNSHKEITDKYENVHLSQVKDVGLVQNNDMRQQTLYQWFCENYKDKMDWCAFIDIDEFVILDGITLEELCSKFNDSEFNAFALWWKMFNANGCIRKSSKKVMERFTKSIDNCLAEASSLFMYKSFINMHKDVLWEHVHKVTKTCDVENNRIDYNPKLNKTIYKYAWINHYFTKSYEEYKLRLKRGNITLGLRHKELFFQLNNDLKDFNN